MCLATNQRTGGAGKDCLQLKSTSNSFMLCFNILVAMYWDGKQSIPIDFSIHNEICQCFIKKCETLVII